MYTYKIFNSITEECESIFNNEDNMLTSTFFQDIEYIKEIIKNKNSRLKIIIIYYNKSVLAILPLEIKKIYSVKVLQWIGTDYSDYCNPILSKKLSLNLNKEYFLNVWKLIFSEIKNEIDIVFFNNQLALINDFTNPFVSFFETLKFSTVYNINLNNNFNDYKENVKNKNKKHAYEIHRTLIKYEKLKEHLKNLTINIQDSSQDFLNFKKVIDEKKTQLFKKNINNKLDDNFKKIFENLIKLKKVNFYIISLMSEKKAISSCFGFVYENAFYYYIPTVLSNSFDNYKPGKILILQIIQWCIKNNIKKFDFGLGSEKYKKDFSNKEISLHRYIKFYTLKGSLAYFFMLIFLKIKRLWL